MKIKDVYEVRDVLDEHLVICQGEKAQDLTHLISLNETSVVLWNAFKGKEFTLADVAQYLQTRYGISQARASQDAESWVNPLVKNGIIA